MDWIDLASRIGVNKEAALMLGADKNRGARRAFPLGKLKQQFLYAPETVGMRFSEETEKWLVRNGAGEAALADKAVIAALLFAKCKSYPRGSTATKVVEASIRSFAQLIPDKKQILMVRAQSVFTPCRKEYHNRIKAACAAKPKVKNARQQMRNIILRVTPQTWKQDKLRLLELLDSV